MPWNEFHLLQYYVKVIIISISKTQIFFYEKYFYPIRNILPHVDCQVLADS